MVRSNAAVLRLVSFLKSAPIDEVVPFDKLEEICGMDIRTEKGRGVLTSSRNQLLNLHDRVLGSVRKIGYKILRAEDVPAEASSYRIKGIRSVKKAAKVVSTVDLSTLNPHRRMEAIGEIYKTNVILHAAKKPDLIADTKTTASMSEADVLKLIQKGEQQND